jgi:hypothetical protein
VIDIAFDCDFDDVSYFNPAACVAASGRRPARSAATDRDAVPPASGARESCLRKKKAGRSSPELPSQQFGQSRPPLPEPGEFCPDKRHISACS